jgi:cysteine desulfurase
MSFICLSRPKSAKLIIVNKPIYMDYQATTPVDPRVLDAMLPWFTERFGNASSGHSFGWLAKEVVDVARREVADVMGAGLREILFTSGATESNNLAIKGVAEAYIKKGRHIISCATEHKAVIEPLKYLIVHGWDVTWLKVDSQGMIDLNELAAALRDDTVLVTLAAANNEIGVVHPLEEIGKLTREKGVLFHVDGAQGYGKFPIDVGRMNIDLMSISGHKIYGPKGVGALYLRRRNPRVRPTPLLHGGDQEEGMRSGTHDVPSLVGLGKAATLANEEMEQESAILLKLRNKFYEGLCEALPGVILNGDLEKRLAGNLNVSFEDVDGDALRMSLRNLAVSSGSACTFASTDPSHVLMAIGVDPQLAQSTLRFGFGRFITEEDCDRALKMVIEAVRKLRGASQDHKGQSAT